MAITKQCQYCHSPLETHRGRFCSRICSSKYQLTRSRIVSLYVDDPKKYADEILRYMKEGSSYQFKFKEAND